MKSPLEQGKKVLFARKLTIGVYSAIDHFSANQTKHITVVMLSVMSASD